MKKVMVAIDFSKTSMNALDYGVMLANKASAEVLMVWVDNTTSDETIYEGHPNELRNEKIELFKELQHKYKGILNDGKLKYKTRKGKVYIEIANLAKNTNTDFIITGTHGVSGFEEFWIGSNAFRILTDAPCPVISLRHDFHVGGINKIVVPIDSSQETRQKIPVTSELAMMFNSEVHILSLYSTSFKSVKRRVDNYARQVMTYMEDRDIKCTLDAKESENITKTTIDYAEMIHADLITIMTEQETTPSNLFLGPYAQQMVNHSPIPIAFIRSKELVRIPV